MNRRTAKKIGTETAHGRADAYTDTQMRGALRVMYRNYGKYGKASLKRDMKQRHALDRQLSRRKWARMERSLILGIATVSDALQEFCETVLATNDKIGALGVAMKQLDPMTRVAP